MVYCPRCGNEVAGDDTFCPNCGANLKERPDSQKDLGPAPGAVNHLNVAFNIASRKPIVFLPTLLGSLVSVIISAISTYWWRFPAGIDWWMYPEMWAAFFPIMITGVLLSLIGAIVSYIMFFASLDMSRDAYSDSPLDLGESVRYVLRRLGTFIVTSIIGAIMAITVILIPVVILMFVIMVIDETGIGDSISKAFRVLGRELGDVIIILLVAIVGAFILGLVPIIGGLLAAGLNVIIGLAFMDLYFTYKKHGGS